jgi:hypothetical protein
MASAIPLREMFLAKKVYLYAHSVQIIGRLTRDPKKINMKNVLLVSITLLAVTTAFRNATNPVFISGKILRQANDKKERAFEILVKSEAAIVAKTITKANGEFELSFTPASEKYFDFFFIDPNHQADTLFLKSYTQFKSDIIKVNFYTFNRHVDDDNHIVCPKCGRSDDVSAEPGRPAYYYCSRDKIKF